ncbi:transcriptional regulator, partial [Streptomyces alkaliterrae]|uniref:transcriptional regulator n=1 Tax=Streptomyces alkaliterrae TaxID=2213162 RepID=UPI001E606B27
SNPTTATPHPTPPPPHPTTAPRPAATPHPTAAPRPAATPHLPAAPRPAVASGVVGGVVSASDVSGEVVVGRGGGGGLVRGGGSDVAGLGEWVRLKVEEAMVECGGDRDEVLGWLLRHAIPDAMELLDACRVGARYDVVGHPPLPSVLRKKSAQGSDEVWEARPRWSCRELPAGSEVTALDINGAYLSALKTHLPLGALELSSGNVHSSRRSGIHLVTPPEWEHESYLPNPMGNREEPGRVWVTEPTLRLMQRLSTDKYGKLCDPPVIHESWTSGSTEHLFEKFRQVMRDARERAIEESDEITLEYVKAMYSKLVSTMGESNFNRELYRPDWMHIIRSQAFVNLWLKGYKAHVAGLAVVRVMGTDELHVAGDWRAVFSEGRAVSQVKVKDTYTVGAARW